MNHPLRNKPTILRPISSPEGQEGKIKEKNERPVLVIDEGWLIGNNDIWIVGFEKELFISSKTLLVLLKMFCRWKKKGTSGIAL